MKLFLSGLLSAFGTSIFISFFEDWHMPFFERLLFCGACTFIFSQIMLFSFSLSAITKDRKKLSPLVYRLAKAYVIFGILAFIAFLILILVVG